MKNSAINEKCIYWNDGFFYGQFSTFLKYGSKTDVLCAKKNCF